MKNIILLQLVAAWVWGTFLTGMAYGADGLATATIEAGPLNSLAVRNDGTAWAWGRNSYGESGIASVGSTAITNPVLMSLTLTNAVAISSGGLDSAPFYAQTLVLCSDGSVLASGTNNYGQLGDGTTQARTNLVVVTNLANVVAISAGSYHSLALKSDGTVWGWGNNSSGQLGNGTNASQQLVPTQTTNLVNAIAISAGQNHSLALTAGGTIWAWGTNNCGQLGDGTTTNRLVPVMVTNLNNIVAISAGGNFSLALKGDGTVWAWGTNGVGQIGIGNTTTPQKTSVQVNNLSNIVAIAAGASSSLALKSDGTVWGWGANDHGQIGNGASAASQTTPVMVANLSGVLSIAAGGHHSLALLTDGSMVAWGDNTNYQVSGIAPKQNIVSNSIAVQGVLGIELAVKKHTIIGKTDGTVWTFGLNGYGQLGNGTTSNQSLPGQIRNLQDMIAAYAGDAHSVSLRKDGSIWAWGWNNYGQLGDGTVMNRVTPVAVANLTGVNSIAVGGQHTLALKSDGTVWGSGGGGYGQLGNGTSVNVSNAVQVVGLSNITAIAAGTVNSLALKQDGTVWAWGANSYGQLGNGTNINQSTPIQATNISGAINISCGGNFCMALSSNGTAWAWGANSYGQLGNASRANVSIPAIISGLSNVVSIKAGSTHVLALKSDGTVWAWGRNTYGQLGTGTTTDSLIPVQIAALAGVIAIGAGENDSFAILTNGETFAWGDGQCGQLGTGSLESQSLPVDVNNLWQSQPTYSAYQPNTLTQTGRFTRGTGSDPTFQTFVIPLEFQAGMALDNQGIMTNQYPNQTPWFLRINSVQRWHYSAAGSSGLAVTITNHSNVYFPFNNPIAAFGSQSGGTPLYINQPTTFGLYGGARNGTNSLPDDIIIQVYRKADLAAGQTNVASFATIDIPVPREGNSNVWSQFASSGFTETVEAYGLRTDLRLIPGFASYMAPYGVNTKTPNDDSPYTLTHTASSSEFFYKISASGFIQNTNLAKMTNWMVLAPSGTNYVRDWSDLYTLDFDEIPPWRTTMIDQPHFNGQPLPPNYLGKAPSELTNLMAQVTNQINLSSSIYTNIDQSPDLHSHPVLDNFVSEMKSDPIALANYVINQIQLTDGIDWPPNNGAPAASSVNLGGVNRSALDTFVEGQGSPTEQCSLLVYLLRKAGYPAAYIYPTNNNILLLDTELSKLLRIQVHGAVNYLGQPYTTNTLIIVNYPWVAAQINGTTVQIFPWLKDTEIIEGFNTFDFMPTNYNSAYKWVKNYVYGDTNILSLDPESNTPRVLFPKFVQQSLLQNHPGLSLTDMGMQIRDRQHYYARWQDFPTPNVVNNPQQSVVLDTLASATITNVMPSMTNIFNTVSVLVQSHSNTNHYVSTGTLRMADILNRRFLIFTNSGHNLTLWMASYRPSITNQSAFTGDAALLNQQVAQVTLSPPETTLDVTFRYNRDNIAGIPGGTQPSIANLGNNYLGQIHTSSIGPDQSAQVGVRQIGVTTVAGICMHVGRVTQAMLDRHIQDYWQMEETRAAKTNAVIAIQDSKGTAAYLMGMSYYKNCSDAAAIINNLTKHQWVSQVGMGLSKLQLNGNNVRPAVDMFLVRTMSVANDSMQPNESQEYVESQDSVNTLGICAGSAEEHNVINGFFNITDAVSTVTLLQTAQKNANANRAGIVQLNNTNYSSLGARASQGYGSTLLNAYDPSTWAQVSAYLGNLAGGPQPYAYMTPANMTNASGSYIGMGALVVTATAQGALITGNLNGGWGDPTSLFTAPSFGGYDASLIGGGITPLSFAPWPPPLNSYMPDTITFSDAADIGSSFLLTPFENISFNWANTLYYSPPNLPSFPTYNLTVDVGNPGELSWWNQLADSVADPVNPLTGAFHIDATDLSLPGPMPLQLRRNYSSQNLSDLNGFGHGWKNAYLPYLTVATNVTGTSTNIVIYAAEMDGSVLAYHQQTGSNTNLYIPLPQDNPTLNNNSDAGIGSTANLFNNRLLKIQSSTNVTYQLTGADGSVRTFYTNSFPLVSATNTINRLRPYIATWRDCRGNFYNFSYGNNSTNTDFGQVNRVDSSNGNFLQLNYNTFGYITEAFTGDGRITQYTYDHYGDLVQVTLPDASVINYQYEHYPYVNGTTNYIDSDHLLITELKPGGHELDNFYDNQRRVVSQKSTVGTDLNTYTNAQFIYNNNFQYTNSTTNFVSGYTILTDVNNNTVRYDYTNDLITKITDQLGQTVQQSWYPDNATAPGYPRSLSQSIDKRGLITQYLYDGSGNATNVVLTGDLTGNGVTNQQAVSSFYYNTNNLLLQVVDAISNSVAIVYDTNYTYLPSTMTLFAGNVPVSTNLLVYGYVSQLVTNGVTLYTNSAYGLLQRTIHAYGSVDASTNDWVYDGRGFKIQEIQYTATADAAPNITNYLYYDSRGELVQKYDQAGRSLEYQYDGIGRVTAKEVFDTGALIPMYQEYSYYDENGNLTWWDGPRSNPDDYIWRDYDGDNRKIQETHWRSRAKADGSGVEAETGDNLYATTFYEYDKYGDLLQMTDPYGNYTRMAYNAVGQMTQKGCYGPNNINPLSFESFAYEPGGKVSIYTNALGGVTYNKYTTTGKLEQQTNPDGSILQWTYYMDGRPRREYLANGNYYETAYDDVNRIIRRSFSGDSSYLETEVFDRRGNPIIVTNAVGAVFTAAYDGANRTIQTGGPATTSTSAQQTNTYLYQNFDTQMTSVNALGSSTVNYDALGRVTTNSVYDLAFNRIAVATTQYSPDFNSTKTTTGSGLNAIAISSFTDTYGKTVLTQRSPTTGVTVYARNSYDVLENLVGSRDELGQTNSFFYDPMNRLMTQVLPDGAAINFGYNPMGSLTNRVMPGGLTWSAVFDSANRILSEQLQGGSSVNRQFTYIYYTSGPTGLLLEKNDVGRGVITISAYDSYMRAATNWFFGSQLVQLSYLYDQRGLLTNLTQLTTTLPATTTAVQRSYDGYGQLTEESILINGALQSDFTQNWEATGHRSLLAQTGAGTGGQINYYYRADGLLTNVWQAGQSYTFGYADNGLLNSRINPWRSFTTGLRDGEGRLLQATNSLGGSSALIEAFGWRPDSTLSSYAATRSGTGAWNDSRNYLYNSRNQLTNEPVGISSSVSATYGYGFDANKLGVRTSAQLSGGLTNGWQATGEDSLGQITSESWNQSGLTLRASGSAVNASSVSATLDGSGISTTLGSGRWYSDLILSVGSHTLAATANYTAGSFAATATSSFTVDGTNSVTDYYDGTGYVTNRIFGTGKTQSLTWDGLGRLVSLNEMDTPTNGFNWTAIYDGLGRRLRTVQTPLVNGFTNSIVALTLDSYFDPQVEFQELAVGVNGQRTWKVMGPDLNGHYGAMNGVGGLEATIRESDGTVTPVLNDYFGNVLATISGTTASWNSVRVGGYGPVLGYEASPLTAGTPLAESLLWRSRRIDPSGFYNLGARYYDPMAGRFLSPDPMGHAGSMDLYSAFNGDPINNFDPDGRFGKAVWNDVKSAAYGIGDVMNTSGGPSYAGFLNGSLGSQISYDVGYVAADAVKLAGIFFATEGAGEFLGLGVEGLAGTESAIPIETEIGGFEAVGDLETELAGSAESGALRAGEDGLAEGGAASSEAGLANTFDASGQGEFGFAKELESAPAQSVEQPVSQSFTSQAGNGASQAEQLELNFTASSSGPDSVYAAGRRGNADTQAQINQIRDQFLDENPDYIHVAGGNSRATGAQLPEEYLPPLNGGRKGGSYPDLTFEVPNGSRIRINTVDTYSDGTMTAREQANFDRIFEQTGEPIIAVPKPKIPKH